MCALVLRKSALFAPFSLPFVSDGIAVAKRPVQLGDGNWPNGVGVRAAVALSSSSDREARRACIEEQ